MVDRGSSSEISEFKKKVLAPTLMYKDIDPRTMEVNLRRYGEMNIPAAVEHLYNQKLSMFDIMKNLHIAVTPGVKENEWVNGEVVVGGEFRNAKVQFGDKVPPAEEDVPQIAKEFASKLDSLIDHCPADKFDVLATWAYITELSLHPFLDANNRGSWAMAEYVRYVGAEKNGSDYSPLPVPSQWSALRDEIVDNKLSQLMFDMKLFPNPYYEHVGLGGPMIAVVVNEAGYFSDVRDLQLAAIRDIDVQKIVSDERLEEFSFQMRKLAFSDKYATKPLDAHEMAVKFKQRLALH